MKKVAERFRFVNFGDVCKGCQMNCCQRFYAVLLPEEEEEYLGKYFTLETPLGTVKCLGAHNGESCPFLSPEGLCLNYEKRPFDCRVWPVLLYYDFKTGEKVLYLDMECPAVAEGRIEQGVINNIVEILRGVEFEEEWIKRYTLAPWPNNLKEICRWR